MLKEKKKGVERGGKWMETRCGSERKKEIEKKGEVKRKKEESKERRIS